MISAEKMQDILRRGICKFVKTYSVTSDRIQLVFMLDEKREIKYVICVDQAPRNTVHLNDIIGKNIYNGLVSSHIKKLLERFSMENQISENNIQILAGLKNANDLYIQLRNLGQVVKAIDIDQLIK